MSRGPKILTRRKTVNLPKDLADWLERAAGSKGVSVSNLLEKGAQLYRQVFEAVKAGKPITIDGKDVLFLDL